MLRFLVQTKAQLRGADYIDFIMFYIDASYFGYRLSYMLKLFRFEVGALAGKYFICDKIFWLGATYKSLQFS